MTLAAFIEAIERISAEIRLSLTWDQKREIAAHEILSGCTGVTVYFADRTRHGSDPPARTATDCSVATLTRAPTSRP